MSEINFTLTMDEANIVMAGLAELPAKYSLALIQKLQQQAAPQMPAPTPIAPPAETTTAETEFAV